MPNKNNKKLLAINGSPRKGNTDIMVSAILESAKRKGAEVSVVYLREKKISFCSGSDDCCPKTNKCGKNDEMGSIYTLLEKSDIIILASPCYFSNVSAMMKNFMDRCNPYYYNNKLKDKKFFLCSVGGFEDSVKEAVRVMENFLKGIHSSSCGSYYAIAEKAVELSKNQKAIKELNEIGERL